MGQIIAKERPDELLSSLGGQSRLNLCSALVRAGVPEKYNTEVIRGQVDAIERSEDRIAFKNTVDSPGIEMARSEVAYSVEQALEIADNLGLFRDHHTFQPQAVQTTEATCEKLPSRRKSPASLPSPPQKWQLVTLNLWVSQAVAISNLCRSCTQKSPIRTNEKIRRELMFSPYLD